MRTDRVERTHPQWTRWECDSLHCFGPVVCCQMSLKGATATRTLSPERSFLLKQTTCEMQTVCAVLSYLCQCQYYCSSLHLCVCNACVYSLVASGKRSSHRITHRFPVRKLQLTHLHLAYISFSPGLETKTITFYDRLCCATLNSK